nr:ELP1B2 protein [Mimosa pudica]
MASSSSYSSPCAACKFLRRKCMPGCIFAPYFPPEEPQKFAHVHKIFGASNVTKLLNELLPHQREDAVNSLAYEAEARVRDPVYGCVGAISFLQRQVQRLQKELDAANADLLRFACTDIPPVGPNSLSMVPPGLGITSPSLQVHHQQMPQRARSGTMTEYINNGSGSNGLGGGLYRQFPGAYNNYSLPYTIPWADTTASDHGIDDGAAAGGGGNGGGGGNL